MATNAFSRTSWHANDSGRFGGPCVARDWPRLHAAAIDRSFTERPSPPRFKAPAQGICKRFFDILLALGLLALLSFPMLVIAVLVRLDGGPAFFGHRRIGANGRVFLCWKFRTMVMNADKVLARVLATDPEARAEWNHDFKLRHDPRVTRIGGLLRITSLDELPQLFNVLKGEMSLVGPRPIVVEEIRRYGSAYHDYARCRPGITGLWQVSGRNDVDYGRRVRLDQEYARHWSIETDCRVLLRTFAVVFQRRGAY
jgi:exopolysaccharide production protein ExoY